VRAEPATTKGNAMSAKTPTNTRINMIGTALPFC
jgi:hypothetical protein